MGFLINGIKKITSLGATEDRSYTDGSDDVQEDGCAIMLIAAAIAAGLLEVVDDEIVPKD